MYPIYSGCPKMATVSVKHGLLSKPRWLASIVLTLCVNQIQHLLANLQLNKISLMIGFVPTNLALFLNICYKTVAICFTFAFMGFHSLPTLVGKNLGCDVSTKHVYSASSPPLSMSTGAVYQCGQSTNDVVTTKPSNRNRQN